MLATLGASGATGLAGCFGGDDDGGDGDGGGDGSGTGDGSDRQVGGTFTVVVPSDAETLVPFHVEDDRSGSFLALTLDGSYAVTASPEDEVFPLWLDIRTDDNQVYVCELRDNLRWSDPYGQMTADDWVYYIQEVHQAEGNWTGSVDSSAWQGVTVEPTGTLEFQIELSRPDPTFPLRPIMWFSIILPRGLLEPYVEERDLEGIQQNDEILQQTFTGNLGPYDFDHWDRDAEFAVTRAEDYYMRELDDVPEEWQNAPYFEGIRYRIIDEESTRLNALSTGEAHASAIPDPRVEEFQQRDDVYVNMAPQPYLQVFVYNQRMNGWEPLRTREVRQAFSYAIDKRAILEQIHRGIGEVTHTFQPTWSSYYVDDQVREFGVGETYSHDRARELLEGSLPSDYGYDGDVLLGPDGRPVALELVYPSGVSTHETTAEYIRQELGEIGIDVELNRVAGQTFLGRYVQNSWHGEGDPPWSAGAYNDGPRDGSASEEDWDLMYGINFNTYPRTPAATDAFWTEQAPTNYFGYVPDADMGSLFSTVRNSTDEQEREDALAELFGILSEDQPVNFVAMSDDIIGYQSRVDGPEEVFGQSWDRRTWAFDEA